MRRFLRSFAFAAGTVVAAVALVAFDGQSNSTTAARRSDPALADRTVELLREGRQTFRFDTFGDEAFWGDTLRLHEAIEGAAHGGVGPGVSPTDGAGASASRSTSTRCRGSLQSDLRHGRVDLDDPADDARAAASSTPSSASPGFFRSQRAAALASASSARSATRPSTTPSRPASATDSTAGPTAT